MSKRVHISSNFFTIGYSDTILVFFHTEPYFWQYSYMNPPNGSVESRRSKQMSRFSTNIWLHRVLSTIRPLLYTAYTQLAAPDRGKIVTLVTGKRRRLLFAGDGRRSVYDKKLQHYAEDNSTEYYIVCGDRSEAAVTKGMFIATQLNSTDPVEQRTVKSVVFLFMTS